MHTFKSMRKRLLFLVTMGLILLNWAGSVAVAQNPRTLEVGPYISGTTYAGDLNVWRNLGQWQWKELNQFHYGFGALARYNHNSRWSFRLDYSHLHLRAGDAAAAWRPQSKLNFKSTIDNLAMLVEFNFEDYYTGKSDKGFSLYILGGISGMLYYVQSFTGDEALDGLFINYDKKRGFKVESELKGRNKALTIPFGLGCKLSISEHLAATVEWRMHYALTDNLDDYLGDHGKYYGLHVTSPDGLYDFVDPTGSFPDDYQRVNTSTNDWFGMLNLSLTWKFVIPEKTACKMTDY